MSNQTPAQKAGFKVGNKYRSPYSGYEYTLCSDNGTDVLLFKDQYRNSFNFKLSQFLKPVQTKLKQETRTMDDLKVGDILVYKGKLGENRFGYDYKVQGVLGDIVFATSTDDDTIGSRTLEMWKNEGWTLKTDELEPFFIDLTKQQIADEFGIEVHKLRIKE